MRKRSLAFRTHTGQVHGCHGPLKNMGITNSTFMGALKLGNYPVNKSIFGDRLNGQLGMTGLAAKPDLLKSLGIGSSMTIGGVKLARQPAFSHGILDDMLRAQFGITGLAPKTSLLLKNMGITNSAVVGGLKLDNYPFNKSIFGEKMRGQLGMTGLAAKPDLLKSLGIGSSMTIGGVKLARQPAFSHRIFDDMLRAQFGITGLAPKTSLLPKNMGMSNPTFLGGLKLDKYPFGKSPFGDKLHRMSLVTIQRAREAYVCGLVVGNGWPISPAFPLQDVLGMTGVRPEDIDDFVVEYFGEAEHARLEVVFVQIKERVRTARHSLIDEIFVCYTSGQFGACTTLALTQVEGIADDVLREIAATDEELRRTLAKQRILTKGQSYKREGKVRSSLELGLSRCTCGPPIGAYAAHATLDLVKSGFFGDPSRTDVPFNAAYVLHGSDPSFATRKSALVAVLLLDLVAGDGGAVATHTHDLS